jgi:peptidyl-prolyl cis-trans isomerase D
MLDFMRRHARKWFMKVILGIIIVVFVLYFGAVGDQREARTLAVLDGNNLVYEHFQREYQDLIELYRRQLGPGLTEAMVRELKIKEQAFDNMIQKAMILRKGAEWSLTVTENELRNSITSDPAFQRNGVFDRGLYEQVLRFNRMTSDEYERMQREMLLLARLEQILTGPVTALAREIRDLEALQGEEVALEAVLIDPKEIRRKMTASREEIEKYYNENSHLFRMPVQFKIEYLFFTQEDEARRAYEIIYQEENFAKYAQDRQKSIKVTEFFPLTAAPAPLNTFTELPKNLLETNQGEIGRILVGPGGFVIFRVLERKEPYVPPLAAVEKEARERYLEGQSQKLAREKAQDILSRLKKNEPWTAIAPGEGIRRVTTKFFQPGITASELGPLTREISEAIFILTPPNPLPGRTFALPDGRQVVFSLKERRRPAQAGEERKEMLAGFLSHTKRQELIAALMADYRNYLVKEGRLKILKEAKDI